jgi:O-antigen/teichoic acid export membrane protein
MPVDTLKLFSGLSNKLSGLLAGISTESRKTAVLYTSASFVRTIGLMLGGFIVIRWIDPQELGLWQSLMIAATYAPVFQLGTTNGLNRDLPYFYGAGQRDKGLDLVASAQSYTRICTFGSILITSLLIAIFILAGNQNFNLLMGIAGVGMIIAFRFYENFLAVTYRANQSFKTLSYAYFLHFFLIMISLPVVYYARYTGLVIYQVFGSFSIMIVMHIVRPVRVSSILKWSSLKELIKTGLPIYIIGYLQEISKSFGKIIILYFGGTLTVGLFSPALAIHTAMIMLPRILAQYFYPKMSFSYGKYNDKSLLWSWVWKISFLIIAGSAIIIIPGWIAMPYLIETFFPKYTDGILAAQLALLSGAFAGAFVSSNVLGSIKDYKSWSVITVIKLLLNFLLPVIFIKIMNPLNGVAAGLLLADIIVLFSSLVIIYRSLKSKT